MPQLSKCFQTKRNRSSQGVKTSVLVGYSRNWSFVMEPTPTLDLPFTLCSIPFTSIAHFSLFILLLACVLSSLWVLIQVCRVFYVMLISKTFGKLKDTIFEKPWIWKQPMHLQAVTQRNAGTSLSMGQPVVPVLSSQCFTDKHVLTQQKKKEINLFT